MFNQERPEEIAPGLVRRDVSRRSLVRDIVGGRKSAD
jgi:hypothetical protein